MGMTIGYYTTAATAIAPAAAAAATTTTTTTQHKHTMTTTTTKTPTYSPPVLPKAWLQTSARVQGLR